MIVKVLNLFALLQQLSMLQTKCVTMTMCTLLFLAEVRCVLHVITMLLVTRFRKWYFIKLLHDAWRVVVLDQFCINKMTSNILDIGCNLSTSAVEGWT